MGLREHIDETVMLLDWIVQLLREHGVPEPTTIAPHAVEWPGSFAMACADGRVWVCGSDSTDFHFRSLSDAKDHAAAAASLIKRNAKNAPKTGA